MIHDIPLSCFDKVRRFSGGRSAEHLLSKKKIAVKVVDNPLRLRPHKDWGATINEGIRGINCLKMDRNKSPRKFALYFHVPPKSGYIISRQT
jgi:hypothetical protein